MGNLTSYFPLPPVGRARLAEISVLGLVGAERLRRVQKTKKKTILFRRKYERKFANFFEIFRVFLKKKL